MADQRRRARTRTVVDPARRVAFAALTAVENDGAYLNLALSGLLAESALTGRDAAFATELAHGTTRLQGTYDSILAVCVAGGTGALERPVKLSLRLGAHQLLSMRVPSHAAVGTSVELVREFAGERPVRMVNAVLRRVAAQPLDAWIDEVAPDPDADPHGYLAVATSHPRWIVDAFAAALERDGAAPERLRAVLAANNVPPKVTLAARPGLATQATLVSAGAAAGSWSPYAAVLSSGNPQDVAEVRDGRAGVQDEGSQLAALASSRAYVDGRDARWLDLCAGPGGKSALLAGLALDRGAALVASELQEHRARLVRLSLRAYPTPAPVLVADGTRGPWRSGTFDRVLADVPCLGLGALRRRPDSRWRRGPADLDPLAALQTQLLEAAIDAVRAGGVVTYVTCSPHLGETRSVVDAVVDRLPVVEEDSRALLPELRYVGSGPHIQLWPDVHGTDAMFITTLRLASTARQG